MKTPLTTDTTTTTTSSASSATTTQWTALDENVIAPQWSGDNAKGSMFMPLYRGGFPGIEDNVWTPADGDCTKTKSTVRVDWDKSANAVTITWKGKGFDPHPVVHRTEGVDWFPNQFHDAPKDITNGGYRLWLILASVARTAHFYYDPNTLQLLGSEFNFPSGAPQPSITVDFPVFAITDSIIVHPDDSGNFFHQYTLAYNSMSTEDKKFSFVWATFIPQDLCEAAPFQPGISQLRPYVSPWQSADQAPTWDNMLGRAISFDSQVEDATPPPPEFGANLPYGFGGIEVAGNVAALQGGVPNGWHFKLVSAIQSVVPALDLVPGGNGLGCTPWVAEPHVTAPKYCQGGSQ